MGTKWITHFSLSSEDCLKIRVTLCSSVVFVRHGHSANLKYITRSSMAYCSPLCWIPCESLRLTLIFQKEVSEFSFFPFKIKTNVKITTVDARINVWTQLAVTSVPAEKGLFFRRTSIAVKKVITVWDLSLTFPFLLVKWESFRPGGLSELKRLLQLNKTRFF